MRRRNSWTLALNSTLFSRLLLFSHTPLDWRAWDSLNIHQFFSCLKRACGAGTLQLRPDLKELVVFSSLQHTHTQKLNEMKNERRKMKMKESRVYPVNIESTLQETDWKSLNSRWACSLVVFVLEGTQLSQEADDSKRQKTVSWWRLWLIVTEWFCDCERRGERESEGENRTSAGGNEELRRSAIVFTIERSPSNARICIPVMCPCTGETV